MKVAIIAHLYYQDLLDEFIYYFKNFPREADIYISTQSEFATHVADVFSKYFGKDRVYVQVFQNRGMDIAPFLFIYKIIHDRYDIICKVHTKKGNHIKFFAGWRTYLLENLIGSPVIVKNIIEKFNNNPKLGIVLPEYFPFARNYVEWGNNYETVAKLMLRLGHDTLDRNHIDFPAGSMFWFRPSALVLLNKLGLEFSDFEKEVEYAIDGMLSHAVERIFFYLAAASGFTWEFVLFQPFLKRNFSTQNFPEVLLEHLSLTNENIRHIIDATQSTNNNFRSTENKINEFKRPPWKLISRASRKFINVIKVLSDVRKHS